MLGWPPAAQCRYNSGMSKKPHGNKDRSGKSATPRRRISGQTVFLAGAILVSVVAVGYVALVGSRGADGHAPRTRLGLRLDDIPFNGARAYEYLGQICEIGPRRSGSDGMTRQQKLLEEHFRKLGGVVERQEFVIRHPENGSKVPMVNLIVRWHPERKRRILLATHYDTLPFPLLDPINPRGRFIGANDGGSGVALLMELAHAMPELKPPFGVDFVFFDGEEFIFNMKQKFFRGSEHFAKQYRKTKGKLPYRYEWGVLLDMIGDKDLQIPKEGYSMSWRRTRPLVEQIWGTASRLGVRDFDLRRGQAVRDDHLALNNMAGIPTCDIIDFQYPSWHTQGDTLDKCSALSLAKVGWVIHEWLKTVE